MGNSANIWDNVIQGNPCAWQGVTIGTTSVPPILDPCSLRFDFSPAPEVDNMTQQLRLVQLYIVDPNKNIPLNDALLYKSEQPFLTNLTDAELWYQVPVWEILDDHNEYRISVADREKTGKDDTVFLEPARILDLVMRVVEVASF